MLRIVRFALAMLLVLTLVQPVAGSQTPQAPESPVVQAHPTPWPYSWGWQPRCSSGCSFNPTAYIPWCVDGDWNGAYRAATRFATAKWNALYRGGLYFYESGISCNALAVGNYMFLRINVGATANGSLADAGDRTFYLCGSNLCLRTVTIQVNDGWNVDWYYRNEGRPMMGNEYDLYSTMLHEVGHTVGLEHFHHPGAIMYHYLCWSSSLNTFGKNFGCQRNDLTQTDKDGYYLWW